MTPRMLHHLCEMGKHPEPQENKPKRLSGDAALAIFKANAR